MSETATPEIEIKRERIVIPEKMTVSAIQKKFKLTRPASRRAKKKVFGLRIIQRSRS